MKKKVYFKPEIRVVNIEYEGHLMTGSGNKRTTRDLDLQQAKKNWVYNDEEGQMSEGRFIIDDID